jgi:hypothetical protein
MSARLCFSSSLSSLNTTSGTVQKTAVLYVEEESGQRYLKVAKAIVIRTTNGTLWMALTLRRATTIIFYFTLIFIPNNRPERGL